MPVPIKKIIFKTLKISAVTLVSLLLLMFLLPMLFPQTVTEKIKQWAAGSVNSKLSFTKTHLSFFKKFPSLTLTLDDFALNGSRPFQNDTLVSAKEISLAIDLSSVFKSKINVNKIYLNQALINIQVDSAGKANYNVYKSSAQKQIDKIDTASASLGIEQILVEKSHLVYNDRSLPMQIAARNFNYKGSGDLSKDVFDLYSHIDASSVDFSYGGKPYVVHKKVNADLVTSINTKSLAFAFQKNDLLINQLPVNFKGRFEFLKDGYDMDFKIRSDQNDLGDIFTAIPDEYAKYVDDMDINGNGIIQLNLTGKFIASKNIMPDLSISAKLRDGYIANKNTPAPVKNLYLNMDAKLPGLNPDSLNVNIDSVYFNIGKDYFGSVIKVRGIKSPYVYAKVNTEIDLEQWYKVFGVKPFQVKGRYSLHMESDGRYTTGIKRTGLRGKIDTVITSVPKFTVHSSFRNGYFKYTKLPQAITNISFDLNAACPDHNVANATIDLRNLNLNALNNYIKGYLKMSNKAGALIDAGLNAKFKLDDITQFVPADSITLKGDLDANLQTKGRYIPAKRIFPVTNAQINLTNGYVQTKYYPHPVQNMQVKVDIFNNTGSLKGLKINIKPVSFNFEGQPFLVKANLRNFDDLDYSVASHGSLDIGKIYKVFAIKGYDVKGLVTTNFSLKGKQSDAVAGHYDKLANSGSMKVKNIKLSSELFPKPFFIRNGVFSFNQDKMNFDQFLANYGKNKVVLNGALSNVIGYATQKNSPLKGEFNLTSDQIVADDFMAFAGSAPSAKSGKSSGVILVPANLDLNFAADVKKVKYNGLDINDAKGAMSISNGQIILKQTGFSLIGAPVVMDATYGSINPQKAFFDYHISAKEFDIQRAYKEIKLFHDMASSAEHVLGTVSLDYKLAGKLNGDMKPVYPSLKGGGVLSVKQVKVYGLKLLSTVGKQTGHDSLGRGDVKKVDIKTTVANNIITIERTKMRIAGFRPRFEGQVGLDGKLNLKFRLGLPPLGIFGIPMTITGTQDKPIIHLGKGKKEDELQETKEEE